jgi:Glucodextranase, domain B/Bacterial Ig domain
MKSIHIRRWTVSFLVFVFLLAGSAGNGSASTQCSTNDLGCIMRVGGALLKMNGLNDWSAAYKFQILHLYQKINPNASYDDLVKLKAFVDAEFEKYKGKGNLNYETIIQIANDIKNQTDPPIPGATQLILEIEKSIDGIVAQSSTTIENYRQSFAAWAASQSAYANNVLLEVDSYCKDNGEVCNNLNAISGPMLGVVMGKSTPVDVIKSIPAIKDDPLLAPIANAVDSHGNWTLDTAGTIHLLNDVYTNLSGMNNKNINFIKDSVDAHQENERNDTPAYLKATPESDSVLYAEKEEDETTAASEGYSDKQVLGNARTAVNVVSMVVGSVLGDSELASQISTYGGAAIQIASAISGFMDAASGMGSGDGGGDGSELGSAVGIAASIASQNYIGAAMSVFSMFSGGSSPDGAILEQIGALRKDIADLSRNMNTRFDRIDTQLNVIMNTLNSNFNAIDVHLGTITGDLTTIKTQLSTLQQQMSKMEMRIMASLQDTQIQDLNANINSAFNYSGAMPYSTWNAMNGWFYTYNKNTASNSTFANQAAPSIVDTELFSWLNSDSIDANVNKLAKYPVQKWGLAFSPPLLPSSGNIPNPVIWSKSAEAFLEFSKLQPWFAALDDNNSTQWMNSIIAEGQKIKRVATAINHNENGLIGKLMGQSGSPVKGLYDSKGKQIFDTFATQEADYYANNSTVLGSGTSKIDIWGDVSQPANFVLRPPVTGVTSGTIQSSTTLMQTFGPLPDSLKLSDHLNNKLKIIVSNYYSYQDPNDEENNIYGAKFTLLYSDKIISSFLGDYLISSWYNHDDAQTYLKFNFNSINFLNLEFINTVETTDNLNQVSNIDAPNDIRMSFNFHQASYYQQVFDALINYTDNDIPPSPNADLFKELSGAKQLLQSYLALGFDRSLKQNDYLKYLTYGDKSIFDGAVCTTDCATNNNSLYAAIKNHITKLNATKQPLPRLDLATQFYKRSDALAGELETIIASISAGTYKEFQSSIDATLDKLGMRINTLKTLAANDSYRVVPGTTLIVAAPGILTNDVQQNGITLKGIVQSLPTHGTLTVNAAGDGAFDGSFTYQPQAGYVGTDSFTYIAQGSRPVDGFSTTSDVTNPATVLIKVSSALPTVGTLAPAYLLTTAGTEQRITATYNGADGAANLASAEILVAPSPADIGSAIRAKYNVSSGTLALYDDTGLATLAATCTPGTAGTLQNSQAILDCGQTTVAATGNVLTVNWAITPKAVYANASAYSVFLKVDDKAQNSSGHINRGNWLITSQAGSTVTVTVDGAGGTVSMPVITAGSATFSVASAAGSHLAAITDNGADATSMLSSGTVTVTNLTIPHNFVVTFVAEAVCGTSNGGTFTVAPATSLCSAGTPSAVTGSGPWAWNCTGSPSGFIVTCSANYSGPPPKNAQTIGAISFTPSTLAVGSTTTAAATATSGLPVTFTSLTPAVCTVNGTTVSGVSTGTCTIAGNQAGDSNYNAAGQVAQNITVILTADITPPAIHLSTLSDGSVTNNATLNVTGTAADSGGIRSVTVNGQPAVTYANGSFSHAVTLQPGNNSITTVVADNAGNTTTDIRNIFLDVTAPTLTLFTPSDNCLTNLGILTVTGSVSETALVQARIGVGPWQIASMDGTNFDITLNLTTGLNTIEVSAIDPAGNSVINTVKRSITFDNGAPNLSVTNPPQDITTSVNTLTISGTVSDTLTADTVIISIDGTAMYTPAVVNGTFSKQLTFTKQKTYIVTVTARDEAGNSATVQRNINYLPPSGATLDLGTIGGSKGNTVTVPVTLTNTAATSLSGMSMDIGYDATQLDNPTTTIGPAANVAGKTINFSYPAAGIFRIGVVGNNTNVIGNGVVANIVFTVKATASSGRIALTNIPTATDPNGTPVIVTGSNGAVILGTKAGDCDGDGNVSIAEVQSAINMFLGLKEVASCVDADGFSGVSIAEVQKSINSFLGL